jgi:hypothetical protein
MQTPLLPDTLATPEDCQPVAAECRSEQGHDPDAPLANPRPGPRQPRRRHRNRTLHDDATPVALIAAPPLLAGPTTGAANETALLALQRLHGNAHVARLVAGTVQRQPAGKVISIGSEQLIVASDAEKTEAEQIFKEVRETYGIRMSSSSGITAIDTDYDKVPDSLKKQVKTTAWKMEELRALSRALVHFAPILGKERANSTRSGSKQETASASKLEQGIDKNEKVAKFTKKLEAQPFDSLRNITLYSSLTASPPTSRATASGRSKASSPTNSPTVCSTTGSTTT